MAARLRTRIVALDALGNVRASATVKFFVKGTATASGATASGTPFAGNLYAAVSGGSPVSTTQTADANGQVIVYTDTPERFDVGVEATGVNARVFTYEPMEIDPSDALLGKAYAQQGTAGSPADMDEYDGSKRYAPITSKIFANTYVSSVAREQYAILGEAVHQSGTQGYATGVYGRGSIPAGHAALTDENGITGVLGEALAESGDVVGPMLRGGNFRVEDLRTSADADALAIAIETNTRADGNVSHKVGVYATAVGGTVGTTTGQGAGTEVDAAFAAHAKKPATPFKYAFAAMPPSYSHISDATEGVLFAATEAVVYASSVNANGGGATTPVARGIDFRNLTVSTSFLECLNFVVASTGAVTCGADVSLSEDLIFTGASKRVNVKSTSATISEHTLFQEATSTSTTQIGAIPGSAATSSSFTAYNNPAPDSGQYLRMVIDSSKAKLISSSFSGNSKDFYILIGASEVFEIERSSSDVYTLLGNNRLVTAGKAFIVPAQGADNVMGGYQVQTSGGNLRTALWMKHSTSGVYFGDQSGNHASVFHGATFDMRVGVVNGSAGTLVMSANASGQFAFNAASPAATPTYTVANPATDRALDVTGDTLAQGLAVLGTLIADLQARGLLA